MKPLKTVPMAACLCVAAIHVAPAQVVDRSFPRSELGLAFGVAQTQQIDATASPLQFGGRGYDASGHYTVLVGRMSLSASADGGVRNLSSAATSTGVVERLTEGEARASIQRAFGDSPSNASFAMGADLATTVRLTAHHYDDPTRSVSDFVIGALTLGPSATFRHTVAGGMGVVQLSVPLVGMVDHPYSDARSAQSQIDARFATVSTLRGVAAEMAYSPAATRRFGIEYRYRLRVLQYADVQPVHSVSQMLSIGFVRRFGTGPR